MSATPLVTIAKQSIGWSIALSVLMILAGILAIVVPVAAGIAHASRNGRCGWCARHRTKSGMVGTLTIP